VFRELLSLKVEWVLPRDADLDRPRPVRLVPAFEVNAVHLTYFKRLTTTGKKRTINLHYFFKIIRETLPECDSVAERVLFLDGLPPVMGQADLLAVDPVKLHPISAAAPVTFSHWVTNLNACCLASSECTFAAFVVVSILQRPPPPPQHQTCFLFPPPSGPLSWSILLYFRRCLPFTCSDRRC
jgi:hypothetical protein